MKKIFLGLILFLAISFQTSYAQTKLGHLDSGAILDVLPEWKSAQKELETFANKLQEALKLKQESLEGDYKKLMARKEKGELPPAEEELKMREFQTRQTGLQDDAAKAQKDVADKEKSLTEPIQKKVLNAIETVAKENGFAYVFDSSVMPGLLFASPNEDVTAVVKKKLGY